MPAEVIKDDDDVIDTTKSVGVVQPINKAYYAINSIIELIDELGAVDKREMMAYSDSVKRAPNLGSYDRGKVRTVVYRYARQLVDEIDKPAQPNT